VHAVIPLETKKRSERYANARKETGKGKKGEDNHVLSAAAFLPFITVADTTPRNNVSHPVLGCHRIRKTRAALTQVERTWPCPFPVPHTEKKKKKGDSTKSHTPRACRESPHAPRARMLLTILAHSPFLSSRIRENRAGKGRKFPGDRSAATRIDSPFQK
jgi:hypothetical protein